MEMVTDADLAVRLHEFLRSSDLLKTTNSIVRRNLEEEFGVDLSDRKVFIREQVAVFLQGLYDESEAAESGGAGGVVVEERRACGGRKDRDKARSRRSNKEARKRASGFDKLCVLSPKLQRFLGVPNMIRTEVVEQVWSYIKTNKLQDRNDRKRIFCDERLREVLDVDSMSKIQMKKSLLKHTRPLKSENAASVKPMRREKQWKQEKGEDSNDPEQNGNRQKRKYSGFLAPMTLSDTLAKFLGTGDRELTRADVIKRVWDYIKLNNLQDPSEKKTVVCDDKLKELFKVDSFDGFMVSKHLSAHLLKPGG